eukprot:Hpha_TRINITY_DN29810_c0_g1::TRINITY_DN29810_c0_g1_i1::g.2898::m.2898
MELPTLERAGKLSAWHHGALPGDLEQALRPCAQSKDDFLMCAARVRHQYGGDQEHALTGKSGLFVPLDEYEEGGRGSIGGITWAKLLTAKRDETLTRHWERQYAEEHRQEDKYAECNGLLEIHHTCMGTEASKRREAAMKILPRPLPTTPQQLLEADVPGVCSDMADKLRTCLRDNSFDHTAHCFAATTLLRDCIRFNRRRDYRMRPE